MYETNWNVEIIRDAGRRLAFIGKEALGSGAWEKELSGEYIGVTFPKFLGAVSFDPSETERRCLLGRAGVRVPGHDCGIVRRFDPVVAELVCFHESGELGRKGIRNVNCSGATMQSSFAATKERVFGWYRLNLKSSRLTSCSEQRRRRTVAAGS